MSKRVIALALDAMSPVLFDRLVADRARFPHMSRLLREGAYGHLHKSSGVPSENSWSTFLVGATPQQSGERGHLTYDPAGYIYKELPAYANRKLPPFYSLDRTRRLALFDVPLTNIEPSVNGLQIFGWGAEENQFVRVASPAGLFEEIVARHGNHPTYSGMNARQVAGEAAGDTHSFRNPSMYDLPALMSLQAAMTGGVRQRTAIVRDLLARGPWDMFLAVYAEMHIIGHLLWHLDMPHPLHRHFETFGAPGDALEQIFAALDAAVGETLEQVADDDYFVLFSPSGMKASRSDVLLLLMLPEFLYRWQTRSAALAEGDPHQPVPALAFHYLRHWKDEVWDLRTPAGERDLISPSTLEQQRDPLDWNPTRWYQPMWPRMKAFALPTYSHGMIRINVRGRDGQGIVPPEDYDRVCSELSAALMRLVDARTGEPVVREVTRTRRHALQDDPDPGDLVVHWQEGDPIDAVQSPDIGRIGPVPYFRSGGHTSTGFCLVRGPGIAPGSSLPADAQVADLPATLLRLMGQDIPPYMEGRNLFG